MKRTVLLTALVCLALPLSAQDAHNHADMKPDPMMEAMMKAATPGEPHQHLGAFAGSWDTTVTMWPAPGAPPMSSSGTSENRMIMGGRYLEQRFSGSFMGMPFEGLGYTGYDNVKKQYWGTWFDNTTTGMMVSTGTGGDAKSFTFSGSMADPMTGKDSSVEEKITITDADHHTMEMWGPGPDGKMYKMMTIAYARKK